MTAYPETLTIRLRLQKLAFFEHRYLSSALRIVATRLEIHQRTPLYRELNHFVRHLKEQLHQRGLFDKQFARMLADVPPVQGAATATTHNDAPPPVGPYDTDNDEFVMIFTKALHGPISATNSFSTSWLDTVTRHRRMRGDTLEADFEEEWQHECLRRKTRVTLRDKLRTINDELPKRPYERNLKRIEAYRLLCRMLRARAIALAEYCNDMCEFSWYMLRRDWDRGRDVFPLKDFDEDLLYFSLDRTGVAIRSPLIGTCVQLEEFYQEAFFSSLKELYNEVCMLDQSESLPATTRKSRQSIH
jgi:hypothetical protein